MSFLASRSLPAARAALPRYPLSGSVRGASLVAWTGKSPETTPGFDKEKKVLTSLPLVNAATCSREELHDYFDNTWTLTEVLFRSLRSEEAFFRPPAHNLRHPKIFYYSHPAALYVNKLRVAGLLPGHINEYYERIFETGVDEMRWDDMSKNHMKWPSIEECAEYRYKVYKAVSDVIMNHPDFNTLGQLEKSKFWAVILGFEHERIHLETSSVLIRELPADLVQTPEYFPGLHPSALRPIQTKSNPIAGVHYPKNDFIEVPTGDVTLGKDRAWPTFGWDNEYGQKTATVPAFAANKFKVTNGEFWHFVNSGGYLTQRYWTNGGWEWRSFRNTKRPHFWVPTGPAGLHQYRLRCIFGAIDMPWDWPVVVNYHEAKAFAAWKNEQEGSAPDAPDSLRILTELEHVRIRDKRLLDTTIGTQRDPVMHHSGKTMPAAGFNLNLAYGSETPVDLFPAASSGFHDVMGNTWEWCEDHFSALPGFKVHPYYDDFSLPCFDALHNIIMGGSWASTGDEASVFARFHFRPHFHQFSSFRLVRPNKTNPAIVTSCTDNQGPFVGTSNPFRSTNAKQKTENAHLQQKHLQEALHQHYDSETVPDFLKVTANYPQRLTSFIEAFVKKFGSGHSRALDVGCGVGGVSFQLSKSFREVIGVDLSLPVIEAAKQLQEKGRITYKCITEGELYENREATVPAGLDRSRVQFRQSDAYCLPAEMMDFDLVVVSNLLSDIPLPSSALGRMVGPRALVRAGGLLVIASPYSWDSHVTPRDLWLGGFSNPDGSTTTSIDGLKGLFKDAFELVGHTEMPVATREQGRKFKVEVTHVSVWRAKAN
eukprot:m.223145 g.223145  ORF g.223145 m.223145 type:complete len:823 (-) comp10879_c0_seq1:94-2562(-)